MTIYEKLADLSIESSADKFSEIKKLANIDDDLLNESIKIFRALYVEYAKDILTEEEAKRLYKITKDNVDLINKSAMINAKIIGAANKLDALRR